jgi:hypothetical protein
MSNLINKPQYPIKSFDEYEVFNRTLESIHKLDDKVLSEWENILDLKEKQLWKDLITTRRIKVQYNDININVPRRIVKLKRSNTTNINDNGTNIRDDQ